MFSLQGAGRTSHHRVYRGAGGSFYGISNSLGQCKPCGCFCPVEEQNVLRFGRGATKQALRVGYNSCQGFWGNRCAKAKAATLGKNIRPPNSVFMQRLPKAPQAHHPNNNLGGAGNEGFLGGMGL